jgi:hypothetical protein
MDVPGVLHLIIIRGIERRKIFLRLEVVSKPHIRLKGKAQADEKAQSRQRRDEQYILRRPAIRQRTLADYWALDGVLKPLLI